MNYAKLHDISPIIKDFLFYMETVKGRSNSTVEEYYSDLRTFFRFFKQYYELVPNDTEFRKINISDIDIDLIKKITLEDGYAYMAFCKNERNNSAVTRARKVSSIRTYYTYLQKITRSISHNPFEDLETAKPKKSLPKYLTLKESVQLLESIDGPYKERDYCIITLFLNCGLRLSELCSLNVLDIRDESSDTETIKTIKVTGKGNKERKLYLNYACISAINAYLKVRPNDNLKCKEALFISRLKQRISNKTVQHIVYQFIEKSGLNGQGYSVHKLRHTAATLMYQHGDVDIRVLKEILGHENLNTTEIYTHLSDKQLSKAINSHPLSNINKK